MPRPESVSAADIARWRQQLLALKQGGMPDIPPVMVNLLVNNQDLAERVWYTGAWLGEHLDALGCPAERRHPICFAHGQKVFSARDPWETAKQALADYQEGRWDEPGEALGRQVFEEAFPGIAAKRKGRPNA